jgi:hypothetical protein
VPYIPGANLGGLQADLGDVQLGAVDTDGVAWFLQTLEGWDSPDVRSEFTDREADHGAWASPAYLGSRPITLTGTIEAPDRAGLESCMEQLRVAAALTDTQLTVREYTPKMAMVRRSGKLLMSYVTDRTATFSVMVTAADPRRYSTTLQSGTTMLPTTTGGLTPPLTPPLTISATTVSGQVDATNAGTFSTRPVVVIDGPVVAPQVLAAMPDGSVKLLNYSQDLATGEQLVIDTDAHSVILNGTTGRRRFLSLPNGWPDIPAGQTVSFKFQSSAYNATAMLTVRWRSAWI